MTASCVCTTMDGVDMLVTACEQEKRVMIVMVL